MADAKALRQVLSGCALERGWCDWRAAPERQTGRRPHRHTAYTTHKQTLHVYAHSHHTHLHVHREVGRGCVWEVGFGLVIKHHSEEKLNKKESESCSVVSISLQPYGLWPFVHGILQTRILALVAIPFSRGSFRPRDRTWVSCTVGRFFTI